MWSETRRKIKALLIIVMLASAEGQHIQNKLHSAGALRSRGSSSSQGEGKPNGQHALDSQVPHMLHIELDVLLEDPSFAKQLQAMAEHMDTFAERMKAKPEILARAKAVAAEMFTLPAEESSYVDSMLPEKMEAMIADQEFQEEAQLLAEDMQKHVVADPDLEASWAEHTKTSQEQSEEEQVSDTMADPNSQRQQEQVAHALHSLMSDPDLQGEAESIAFNIEQMKDSHAGHNTVDEISQQVNSVLASPKLREKASDVVLEMLSADLQGDLSEFAKAVENRTPFQLGGERLEKEDMEELAKAAENPSPELVKAMEKTRNAKTKPPALLEADTPALEFSPHSQALSYIGGVPMSARPKLAPSITRQKQLFGADMPRMRLMGPHAKPALGSRATPSAHLSRGRTTAMSATASGFPDSATGYPASRIGGSAGTSSGTYLTSARGIRSMMPSLTKVLATRGGAVMSADGTPKKGGVDVALLLCLAIWYLGNYYYNITNKYALVAAGGAAGFPMTIATMQLGIGVIYALFMWLAPDARKKPTISFNDYVKTLPLGAATAAAHAATTFSLSAGSVSFASIVKSAEPAFAAVIATFFYSAKISKAKWLSLIPIIGGVGLASLGELNFAMASLVTASLANVFAAIKGNENSKVMKAAGLSDRIGSVGNQFALTTINAFLFMVPLALFMEGAKFGQFLTLLKTSPVLLNNAVAAGGLFYLYNELATIVIKKTNAVTASVANTAKRVIIIIGVALVMNEGLSPLKLVGSGIAIGGVFLYSIIDKLVASRKKKATPEAKPEAGDGPITTRRLMAPTFV
jgi:solute carrier family 35 protein E1